MGEGARASASVCVMRDLRELNANNESAREAAGLAT